MPALEITNDDMASVVETSDEWISARTGIRGRRFITNEDLTALAAGAGRLALEDAGLDASEIDLIICSTIQGDYITPSLANLVQRDLGASCPAFDINAACCGFLYGLDAAHAYIGAGKAARVLLISAEHMSKFLDWTDRSTCVLFGDGAAAAVLGGGSGLRYITVDSNGQTESLRIPAHKPGIPFARSGGEEREKSVVYMNGQSVFKFAVSTCTDGIRRALDTLKLTAGDIAHYILHQANGRIIDAVRRALDLPEEKFPTNIRRTANMSSVTIPCLLDELNRAGRLKRGERLVLSAFGAGLTAGTCVLEWQKEAVSYG
jgi:3-oxoacyl-[acyl-carrier-protein] synthase-3